MNRLGISSFLLLATLAPPAEAVLSDEVRQELTAHFSGLAEADGAQRAGRIVALLTETEATNDEWREYFAEYFQSHPFTAAIGELWTRAIAAGGPTADRLAVLSGLNGAAALGAYVPPLRDRDEASAYDSVAQALTYLTQLQPLLAPTARKAVFDAIRAQIPGTLEGLMPAAGSPPVAGEARILLGAQLAVTFAEYAPDPAALAQLVGLVGAGARFHAAHGLLLLDNNALDAQQLASLDNLLRVIPSNLHAVRVIAVPEGTGIGPGGSTLALATGQVVYVSAIPMNVFTSPGEFIAVSGQPVAPLFTITAAQAMTGAIQAIQFARRPELRIRRDAILWSAGTRAAAYLRRSVAPAVYIRDPAELLPAVAYMWFVNSEAAFLTASGLMALGQYETMDQVLLLADMLSGGGGEAPLYATDLAGQVFRVTTPVARTVVTRIAAPVGAGTGGVPYLNGIVMDGMRWRFDISWRGVTGRAYKWIEF